MQPEMFDQVVLIACSAKAARSIALLSYRTSDAYNLTQSETSDEKLTAYRASSCQQYQGEKLVKRFNAYSYMILTRFTVTDCPVPDTCVTENVTWGGETYTGVRMGNQCWMDRNLNYGTLLGDQEPDDNGGWYSTEDRYMTSSFDSEIHRLPITAKFSPSNVEQCYPIGRGATSAGHVRCIKDSGVFTPSTGGTGGQTD